MENPPPIPRRHGRAAAFGVAFVFLVASLGALDLAWGGGGSGSAADARAYRLFVKAYRAGERGRWSEAERLYRKALEVRPDAPRTALEHAAALGRLGRTDEALAALEEAAELGALEAYRLNSDLGFASVRSDPRFGRALARFETNLAAAQKRIEQADAPLPVTAAPAFKSLEALNAFFEREERRDRDRGGDWASSQVYWRTLRMRRIAALERYVAEHPGADDVDEAALLGLRAWAERAASSEGLPWRTAVAAELGAAADVFLATRPTHAAASEARFHALAARTLGGDAGPGDPMLGMPRAEACASTLPDLTAMAADPEAGDMAPRASALLALCLHATRPEDTESFQAAFSRWKAAGGQNLFDRGISRHLTAAALRALGPPDFTLPSHTGQTVTLSKLRGKVVVLNFWSPG